MERALSGIPGLYDVKSSLQRGSPEVQIVYRRDLLASYGLNLRSVATLVREKVQGDVVTRFREADRRIDVLVRVDEADRSGVSDLKRLVVNPDGEAPIYLSAVADIQVREGPSEIRRIDQQRAVLISANVAGIDLGTATALIQQALEDVDIPADVSFVIGGQNREMQTSLQSLIFALCLAVFLVYIVMASQFESFVHPFVIIFTIPLALIGVLFTLFVTGISFSVVVFLGLIMLAGIVVNNAIVFVDYINHLRADGRSKADAIVQAGSVRLRPILMTTATTVLGLLPMALGLGRRLGDPHSHGHHRGCRPYQFNRAHTYRHSNRLFAPGSRGLTSEIRIRRAENTRVCQRLDKPHASPSASDELPSNPERKRRFKVCVHGSFRFSFLLNSVFFVVRHPRREVIYR